MPTGRRYEDLAELHAYAARVAGTVGAMMALLMGVARAGALARACDLGVAMQLTNIARDVGEDARAGRLYLPLRLAARGRHRSRRLAGAPGLQRGAGAAWSSGCCDAADVLYRARRRRHRASAARLPARRSAPRGMLYAEIGSEVERRRAAIRSASVPSCRHPARPACWAGRLSLRR